LLISKKIAPLSEMADAKAWVACTVRRCRELDNDTPRVLDVSKRHQLSPHANRSFIMTTMTDTDLGIISSDKVEGTSVYDTGGHKLGSIDDLMVDKLSGQVRYAVMEFGGFLGMGTERFPIPWKVLKYSTAHNGYIVPLNKAILDEAPRYSEDEIPLYDQAYGSRVDSYYRPYV
jgi:sporulation protein YlmC with PRC-barrel domain